MTTNAEAATAILEKHRLARRWDDAVVAADLLAQLDLDPAGVAAKAAVVATVALADVEAATAAARAAAWQYQIADDKASKLRAEYEDQQIAARAGATGQTVKIVEGSIPPKAPAAPLPNNPPNPPNPSAQQAASQHPASQATPPTATSVNAPLPNAVPTATLPTPSTTPTPPASATVSGVTSPTPPL